jgi:catalase
MSSTSHPFNGRVEDPSVMAPPLKISGDAGHDNHRDGNDDYKQPGDLFRLMDGGQRKRLCMNFAEAMQGVPDEIAERQCGHCDKADPAFGAGIRAALAELAAAAKAAE